MWHLTPDEFLDRLQLVATVEPEPVAIVAEQPTGPVVELDNYRTEMAKRRLATTGKPGYFLDTGPTGSGKSTADLAAFATAGRSLPIQPTRQNCEDVVSDCLASGLEAAAYPGRFSKGESQNCWNFQADAAERIGLCVVRAVCNAGCEHRGECAAGGYLGQVAAANAARVAVATHARAIHTGLAALSEGRDFITVHEDSIDVLCPQAAVPAVMLESARDVLHRLLNEPRWLNGFGPAVTVGDDGETLIPDDRKTERRDAQYQFFCHLADVVDRLIELAAQTSDANELPDGNTMPEPPGTQAVLFRICRELKVNFGGKAVWSLLFYTATGEFFREGVLIHELNANCRDTNRDKSGRQSDLSHATEPAES